MRNKNRDIFQQSATQGFIVTLENMKNYVTANTTGVSSINIANQIIILLLCKIYDEKHNSSNPVFRVTTNDNNMTVAYRIIMLFDTVKKEYSNIIIFNENIMLDPDSLYYIVNQLSLYTVSVLSQDVVAQCFEVFTQETLKSGQGQFFTPRNIIKLIITIVNPSLGDLVIDPACGAGGFLVETLKHKHHALNKNIQEPGNKINSIRGQQYVISTIMGIEKDVSLAKIAQAYMTILGDGNSRIFCEDSLDNPTNWDVETQKHVTLNEFDVVLANPPFGKDIKVTGEAKLAQYDLAYKNLDAGSKNIVLLTEQNPQILFVERCIQLAKNGGIISIILPETYFHAPTTKNVRVKIMEHNIIAVIDLPHNTFRPFNNAKCVAIIFQKNCPQDPNILMVDAKEMGHNHNGKPIYRLDPNNNITSELWDDISSATQEILTDTPDKYTFHVPSDEVKKTGILIPRHYRGINDISSFAQTNKNINWITLEELIADNIIWQSAGHGSPPAQMKGLGKYPYIRVKDIINWEIYRDPTAFIPQTNFDQLYKRLTLEENDILYVSRGSYRIGDCALVGPDDTNIVITREIHVLRVLKDNIFGLTPYYLLYLLSTPIVQQQTRARIFLDTTLPNIADRYQNILLPYHKDEQVRASISQKVHRIVSSRQRGITDMRTLINSAQYNK